MTKAAEKFEIVCIKRYGQSIRNTEGADFAAKVTYQGHTPGEVFDPSVGVKQEWLVPLLNHFG